LSKKSQQSWARSQASQHSSDTVESEGRQMKQCLITYMERKTKKFPLLYLSNTRTCECDKGEASCPEAVEKGEPILASTCREHDSNQVAETTKSMILKDFGVFFLFSKSKKRMAKFNQVGVGHIEREKKTFLIHYSM